MGTRGKREAARVTCIRGQEDPAGVGGRDGRAQVSDFPWEVQGSGHSGLWIDVG